MRIECRAQVISDSYCHICKWNSEWNDISACSVVVYVNLLVVVTFHYPNNHLCHVWHFSVLFCSYVGQDSVVRVTTHYQGGQYRDQIPVETRFSASFQSGPGSTQPPVQWVPGPFPGSNAARAWHWLPTLIWRRGCGKSRAELYLCSPSGPTWTGLGWTLPFTSIVLNCLEF